MNISTDPVLEFLECHELALPPGAIKYNILRQSVGAGSPASIDRAIKRLREHGLIQRAEGQETFYEITRQGRAYLEGELDASELSESG